MPFIPSRAFVLLALAPLVLALGMLFDKTLLWPMLATVHRSGCRSAQRCSIAVMSS